MADSDNIIDQYSSLDYKSVDNSIIPGWVKDPTDIRRLHTYNIARSYIETCARRHLSQYSGESDADFEKRQSGLREYGDPAVYCTRIASAITGEGFSLGVTGAGDPISDAPDIGDPPVREESDDPEQQQVLDAAYVATLEQWQLRADFEIEHWKQRKALEWELFKRQRWLTKWEEDEQVLATILENEMENTVPTGDGVVEMGWDHDNKRPTVVIHPPESYFPDLLTVKGPGKFPSVVHIVWRFNKIEDGEPVPYIHQTRYELVDVNDPERDQSLQLGAPPAYLDEGKNHLHSCLVTEREFLEEEYEEVGQTDKGKVLEKVIDGNLVAQDNYATGLDFIPVIHEANMLAKTRHYGRSSLARLFQLFDELNATDVDEALATRWAGQPPAAVSGMNPGEDVIDMSPGTALRIKDTSGGVTVIEMAQNLAEIGNRIQRILKRASVNSSVPEGLLGRVDASEVPSGVTLAISFTGFQQTVLTARLARHVPMSLIGKFAQRIAIVNGDETLDGSTDVYPTHMVWGPFLPQDLETLSKVLQSLRSSGVISLETAVAMLAAAGSPVPEVALEVAAIESRDFAGADALTGATERPEHAEAYLKLAALDDGVDPDGDPGVGVPVAAIVRPNA